MHHISEDSTQFCQAMTNKAKLLIWHGCINMLQQLVTDVYLMRIAMIAGMRVVCCVIPTCTLRGHSKMGKIGHGVKKLRIVLKSLQLVTKGINHGIKGGKDTVRKSFFP